METPSAEILATLEEVRTAAQDLGVPYQGLSEDLSLFTDQFLLRFIRARQGNAEKAIEMLSNHFRWLHHQCPVALMSKPFPELPYLQRFYPTGYHSTDKIGRPVYIERLGMLDMARLMQHVTHEQVVENYIRESERQIRVRLPACSLVRGEVITKSLNIVDLSGLSFSLVTHSMAKKVVKDIITISQDHYPEMLGHMIVINCPALFRMAWSFIKPMLDENTIKKIQICETHRSTEALLELIDAEQLPAIFGGRCECSGGCLASNRGPWQRPEVLAHLAADPDSHWKALTASGCRAMLAKEPSLVADAIVETSSKGVPPHGPVKNGVNHSKPGHVVESRGDIVAVANPSALLADEQAAATVDGMSEAGQCVTSTRENFLTSEAVTAKQELRALQQIHKALEKEHIDTLTDWVHIYRELLQQIGRQAIERAQTYYDAHFVREQLQRECTSRALLLAGLNEQVVSLSAHQQRVEESFYAFLEDPAEASVSDNEWKTMLPDAPECPADFRDDGKLLRNWRMAALSDRLVEVRRQRDSLQVEFTRMREECEVAIQRSENEDLKHKFCTWNCSVQLAKAFYERRRDHEVDVDRQVQSLRKVETQIALAKARLQQHCGGDFAINRPLVHKIGDELSDSSATDDPSVSAVGARRSEDHLPADYEVAGFDETEFLSCSEDEDGSDTR
eukprot:TRINITY_DN42762_c0_g1_i1.p1 TRINITY_DN42762_c0_g1~~TRINITY_DN42762_c0_g1_i1.p1  ORF type:complete len:678 (-),score=129.85 TRINITY_DN42762_c0_g1_i1:105-2138(-)